MLQETLGEQLDRELGPEAAAHILARAVAGWVETLNDDQKQELCVALEIHEQQPPAQDDGSAG